MRPERISVWWRKARLNGAEASLDALIRAKEDPLYRIQECVSFIIFITLSLALILFSQFVVVLTFLPTAHNAATSAVHHAGISDKLTQLNLIITPYYLLGLALLGLRRFTKNLTHFDEKHSSLRRKIEQLREKLGEVEVLT